MKQQLSLPKGTRDFYGITLQKRYFIINTIKHFFSLYGFEPLETPCVENTNTLLGKYGEEGEKLIFRILNNGDIFKDSTAATDTKQLVEKISDRALRYDLTIPFARFVTMNYGSLTMPFKRYQIQPVWRGDRPQRGRYREFFQCDADLVGSNSLLHEVEFVHIYQSVFDTLKIPQTSIKINSRKILSALIEHVGITENATSVFIAIDKIDKIGVDGALQELEGKLTQTEIETLRTFFSINAMLKNAEKIDALKTFFASSELAKKGLNEIEYVLQYQNNSSHTTVEIDLTLARGLDYYTGLIFEVKTKSVQMGSIGGGGRYDNLTASMGVENLSGVGISFGIDRIFDVMEELQLFPSTLHQPFSCLFFNMGESEMKTVLELSVALRLQGVACEVYHQKDKLEKQFKYAEKKNIPLVMIIGEQEIQQQIVKVKNIVTGKEKVLPFAEIKTNTTLKIELQNFASI